MAKEPATHRTLTPEEQARRKATMSGNPPKGKPDVAQVSEHGIPLGVHQERMALAAQVPSPIGIDYDRDGYPDAIVGRSGRNFRQRARHANGETQISLEAATAAASLIAARRRDGRGAYAPGDVGTRQDQIGYRQRARIRFEAIARAEKTDQVEPTLVPKYTPAEEAAMAPRTPLTGFASKGAQRATTVKPRLPGDGEEVPPPVGPYATVRRASFGTVPTQGTIQPDGSFAVGGGGEGTSPPIAIPTAKDHAKAGEHTRPVEHAKPAEHAKPVEHKPAEHAKHPEPHKK
jgi:hypothetical protein